MGFVRAARKDEIPAGSIREFQVDGLTVAIANVGDKFYAINNTCLHRGGPLGKANSTGGRHLPLAWLAVRCDQRQARYESGDWGENLRHRGRGDDLWIEAG